MLLGLILGVVLSCIFYIQMNPCHYKNTKCILKCKDCNKDLDEHIEDLTK